MKSQKKTIAVTDKENTPRQRDIEGATKDDSNPVTEESGEGSQKLQESSSDEATRKAEEKKKILLRTMIAIMINLMKITTWWWKILCGIHSARYIRWVRSCAFNRKINTLLMRGI